MELNTASDLLASLGHPGRLAVLRLLARRAPGGVRPMEIAAALDMKPNTLSVYLSALERGGLLRSERQGKSVFYSVQMPAMGALVDFLVADCCQGRPDLCASQTAAALSTAPTPPDRPFNVLFICQGNSARSIFAEALLRDLGGERFRAYSAGTKPFSWLNPFAVELLQRNGHEVGDLRSKSLAEFQGDAAPQMDFVFTVCDAAANEDCPPWPGQPLSGHWGLPDPVRAEGGKAGKALAFAQTYGQMRARVQAFAALPFDQLDKLSLQRRLDQIGQMQEGADQGADRG